jgi:hypothetical protein
MQTFLTDLKLWLEQVELGIRSLPAADRAQAERDTVQQLQQSASPALTFFFEKFEALCQNIPRELQPAHRAYVKRQLHPLVLCAPFMYRTFQKPLGYAGDYEMINMMTRDPREGASVFAKILNEETLAYTQGVLNNSIERHSRATTVELLKKSVVQVLKESAKPTSAMIAGDYDFVYCAGLFDYLPDRVCEQLINTFYRMLAPNGLLLVTNVDEINPSRNWMEYSVDWHLIYRNHSKMKKLAPQSAPEELCRIRSEPSGVNIFFEVRKPYNG